MMLLLAAGLDVASISAVHYDLSGNTELNYRFTPTIEGFDMSEIPNT